MGDLNGRLRKLESLLGLAPPPERPGKEASEARAVMVSILDEVGRLRACRANSGYRGGTPMPTPIQPTDPVGGALGYPYTWGELTAFAIRRVFEHQRSSDEGAISGDGSAPEQIMDAWVQLFKDKFAGSARDWDEVLAEGPPEPTPPFR